jgi:hypothetical protein
MYIRRDELSMISLIGPGSCPDQVSPGTVSCVLCRRLQMTESILCLSFVSLRMGEDIAD